MKSTKDIQKASGLIEDIKFNIRSKLTKPRRSVISTSALFCLPKHLWDKIEDAMNAAFAIHSMAILDADIAERSSRLENEFGIIADLHELENEVATEMEQEKLRREAPEGVAQTGDGC